MEGPQPGRPSATVTKSSRKQETLGKHRTRLEGSSFPDMGQNGLPQGLHFLEKQGLYDGDYSSAGCGRRLGTHGKYLEPPRH